jgi:hypothetical protein
VAIADFPIPTNSGDYNRRLRLVFHALELAAGVFMTEIKVVCPSCSALLKLANPSLAGKKIRCPKCKGVVPVPADAGSNAVTPASSSPSKKPEAAVAAPNAIAEKAAPPATPRPKMTAVSPPPRHSKLPLILFVLLFVFLLFGGPSDHAHPQVEIGRRPRQEWPVAGWG